MLLLWLTLFYIRFLMNGKIEKFHIDEGGKKLRWGFTTGSAAAGAAKAACYILYTGKKIKTITIECLEGTCLDLTLDSVRIFEDRVECSIRKDAGDDPDITNTIAVFASVKKNPAGTISISGGEGVGVVTRKGLACAPGQAAINPGPRKMITAEVSKVLPRGCGVFVEISAPGGKVLAAKTLNPDLGIEGGISILGTTGLVKPMSEDAFKESLALKISVLKEEGIHSVMFVPGNYGRDFAVDILKLPASRVVIMSNFVGFMLDQAVYYGIKHILLVGHPGKLVKVAGGIFNTHSKAADARLEILAAHYIKEHDDLQTARRILNSNTVEEAAGYITDPDFFDSLTESIKKKCEKRTGGTIDVECLLFSLKGETLGSTRGAKNLIDNIKKDQQDSSR